MSRDWGNYASFHDKKKQNILDTIFMNMTLSKLYYSSCDTFTILIYTIVRNLKYDIQ